MKKVKVVFLFLICFLFSGSIVKASGSEEFYKIASEQDLNECISNQSMCELTSDINLSMRKEISKALILDLNGHTISPKDDLQVHAGLIRVGRGGKLTIIDTKGNGKITTGNNKEAWAAIDLADKTESDKISELIVNSGTLEGFYYGITGNGDAHNTKITINGGNIKALNEDDSVAIYHPQKGTLEINNGTIIGGTGIEIRSGNLIVNGGTITGNAKTFLKMANSNGTTTQGVGIAVAQHVTNNDINVKINNGNISGIYGLYEWNPQNSSAIDKVKMQIINGDFKATSADGSAVYSADFTNFISGGKFNTDVKKYLTDNAQTTMKKVNIKTDSVNENKSPVMYILAFLVIASGIAGYGYYQLNKNKIKKA